MTLDGSHQGQSLGELALRSSQIPCDWLVHDKVTVADHDPHLFKQKVAVEVIYVYIQVALICIMGVG